MKPRDYQFTEAKPGDSEPHYKDSDFSACPDCGERGVTAPDLKGKSTFFHRVLRNNGMMGFEKGHKP